MVSRYIECPICFQLMNKKSLVRYISPCGHCLCKKCGEEWLDINPICPICRQEVIGITPWIVSNRKILKIKLEKEIGITLNKHKNGLKITNIVAGGTAYESGLVDGDIINYINGIPFRKPSSAIKLLKTAKNNGFLIEFTLFSKIKYFFNCMY